MLSICESEARAPGNYERWSGYLIADKRFDDAECWAKEGIEKDPKRSCRASASSLAASLCEVSRGRKQWDVVAAHAAWRFFEQRRVNFDELMLTPRKPSVASRWRAGLLHFLETGVSPVQWKNIAKGGADLRIDPAWPFRCPRISRPAAAYA